jgi:hypothetical protein
VRTPPVDANTNNTPFAWVDNDWAFQIGWFTDVNFTQWISDISTLAEIYVELRPWVQGAAVPNPGSVSPAVSGNTTSFTAVTGFPANWAAGTGQLATIIIPKSATGRSSAPPGTYWLTVYATTSDGTPHEIALAAGLFIVGDTGTT